MALFKERMLCPVCAAFLGEREKSQFFMSHCEECKTTFIWQNKCKKPESQLDKKKEVRCGCKNCGR